MSHQAPIYKLFNTDNLYLDKEVGQREKFEKFFSCSPIA